MKRFAALAAVLLLLCVGGFALAEEAGTAPDEWTVLFYFCGSDLESKYGYASEDLKEIGDVMFPYDYSNWGNFGAMRDVGKVNVLIETGGSRAWHTKEKNAGIDVSADVLQRWRLDYYHPVDWNGDSDKQKLELAETLPLRSMGAPETVYGQDERLPGIDTIEDLQVTVKKLMTEKGVPALAFPEHDMMVRDVRCNLYKLDEETNEIIRLGQVEADSIQDPEGRPYVQWTLDEGMKWLTVEGQPCCAELIKYDLGIYLYRVPVRINSETKYLRCGRIMSYDETIDDFRETYEAFGVWEGYDENSVVMTRGVLPISQAAGRVFCLLYPNDSSGKDGRIFFASGDEMTMPRALRFLREPLPAGTYYLEFELHDAFRREARMERIEIRWDGERIMFPEGFTWDGSFQVEWTR